jgi:hypothetical protein
MSWKNFQSLIAWLSGFMLGASSVAYAVHRLNVLDFKQEPYTIAVFFVGWVLLAWVFVLSNKK